MQITAQFNKNDRVFGTWIIQECISVNNEYSLYEVKAEDEQSLASFWVVDFPATADDIAVLEENGMTREQAIAFFKEAAEDFIGSLQNENVNDLDSSLLAVNDVQLIENDDGAASVYLLTENVYPLSDALHKGFLPVEEIIKIGLQLCDAVSCIRTNNLPRRLLTIDNIFVDYNGNYHLGCFGNASDNRFQSPEEHRGDSLIYNAEVHSIGVILYTLLNENRLPLLPARSYSISSDDVLDAVQNRHAGVPLPPPMHSSAAFTGIVLKACAYKPKARFSSVEEFKSALINLRGGHVVVVSASELRKNDEQKEKSAFNKTIASVITVAVVVIISGFLMNLIFGASQKTPSAEPTSQTATDNVVNIYTDAIQATTFPVADSTTLPPTTQSVVTDPVADSEYPDAFFKQIAVYHGAHYYIKGVLEQDGESKATEVAVSRDGSIFITTDMDGSVIGMLRAPDGVVYLVNPANMTYLEMSKTVLRMLGMSTDSLDKTASLKINSGDFVRPDEIYKVMYREQEFVCCEYLFGNGNKELFYLDEAGMIQYVESYNADGSLENVLIIESVTEDIPAGYIAPTDSDKVYTGVKGMFEFVSALTGTE